MPNIPTFAFVQIILYQKLHDSTNPDPSLRIGYSIATSISAVGMERYAQAQIRIAARK